MKAKILMDVKDLKRQLTEIPGNTLICVNDGVSRRVTGFSLRSDAENPFVRLLEFRLEPVAEAVEAEVEPEKRGPGRPKRVTVNG